MTLDLSGQLNLQLDPNDPLETPVQTRDGHKARIICTDMGDKYPIVAVLELGDNDNPWPSVHRADGREWTTAISCDSHLDLINIPEKRWALIYQGPTKVDMVRIFNNKTDALRWPQKILGEDQYETEIIACLEFTEGDGLD
jgi:hypothetical protein